MISKIKRFYISIFALFLTSTAWIVYNNSGGHSELLRCPFKRLTGIPCPACGLTTGVNNALQGKFIDSFYNHPFAFFVIIGMMLSFILLVKDAILSSHTLYQWYIKVNSILKKPKYFVSTLIIIGCVWVYQLLK